MIIQPMPLFFVVLWSTGFIAAKYGLPYAPPMSFLILRCLGAVLILLPVVLLTGAVWPRGRIRHVALAGLLLQSWPSTGAVIAGRCLYGWAFFQSAVRFDALLFHVSDPASYAVEYSKIHFFQNLGVLTASFSAGILVEHYPLNVPFIVAFAGYLLVAALYYQLARPHVHPVNQS